MTRSIIISSIALCALLSACSSSKDEGGAASNTMAAAHGEAKSTASASDVKLKPGQWQLAFTMEDVKVEGGKVPGQNEQIAQAMKREGGNRTVKTCLTPEQAARQGAEFLSAQKDVKNCTRKNVSLAGGKMNLEMSCTGGPGGSTLDLKSEGSYGPERYEVISAMKMTNGVNGMTMTTRTHAVGKWLGATCAKEG